MSSSQKPVLDLNDYDEADDAFKIAAKAACEKIVSETTFGFKSQYNAWKTRLETETDPKMRRKLEAAIEIAEAVGQAYMKDDN